MRICHFDLQAFVTDISGMKTVPPPVPLLKLQEYLKYQMCVPRTVSKVFNVTILFIPEKQTKKFMYLLNVCKIDFGVLSYLAQLQRVLLMNITITDFF